MARMRAQQSSPPLRMSAAECSASTKLHGSAVSMKELRLAASDPFASLRSISVVPSEVEGRTK
jgi:hypothetical protein